MLSILKFLVFVPIQIFTHIAGLNISSPDLLGVEFPLALHGFIFDTIFSIQTPSRKQATDRYYEVACSLYTALTKDNFENEKLVPLFERTQESPTINFNANSLIFLPCSPVTEPHILRSKALEAISVCAFEYG